MLFAASDILDGIYDVVELLKEYPDYASFVDDAFVSNKHFADSTQLSSANESLDLPFGFKRHKVFDLPVLAR